MEKPTIKASRMSNWSSGLPQDLLASILQRLSFEDCIRFGAVCVSWRSLVAERGGYPPSKLPWLLLPRTKADEDNGTCNFYSLSDRKEYKIHLPGVRWRRCLGSSNGWLVILDERFEMSLLNPLTRSQIRLPSLTANWPWPLDFTDSVSVAVSCSSVSSSYTVVFIVSGSSVVAFVRAGDEAWTMLDEDDEYGYYHLVHHKGLFYIQDCYDRVYSLDPTVPSPKFTPVGEGLGDLDEYGTFQLVQSLGDLFQLLRRSIQVSPWVVKTIGFEVFKLDSIGSEWIRAKTLGNQALFLGRPPFLSRELSMSLSAHDFPGLKGSCIYFSEGSRSNACGAPKVIHDMRVFDLEDGSIKTYHPHDSQLICPIPIWFVPNLS